MSCREFEPYVNAIPTYQKIRSNKGTTVATNEKKIAKDYRCKVTYGAFDS